MEKSIILSLLGKELRIKRHQRNLTQEKAAELLEISTRWYQKLEAGTATPEFLLLCNLILLFDIDIMRLCKGITTYVETETAS